MTTATLTISEILSHLMFEKKIRAAELSRQTNVPQPTVQRIVTGTTSNPHHSTLETLADYFSVSVEQLKGLAPIPWLEPKTLKNLGWSKVPLLSWTQLTNPLEANQEIEGQGVFTDAMLSQQAFGLKMQDSSMEPLFPKDTILVIDPDKIFKDRSYVVVQLKKHPIALFRQIIIDGPYKYLKPISPDFENYKMALLSPEDKILGVLVEARRNYED